MNNKTLLKIGAFSFFLAVALGAFGAHGLEKLLNDRSLKAFETGVRYQFYHSFGYFILAFANRLGYLHSTQLPAAFLSAGLIFFSGFCYVYALTAIKSFALIVPVGGVCYLTFWALLFWGFKSSAD